VTTVWVSIAAVALVSLAIKAAGPAVLGDRTLPARATGVIAFLACALLSGLVVVAVLGRHWDNANVPLLAGLAAVVVARWRGVPGLLSIMVGVAITALLRLLL
jgi:branched-subunit amino acid transport protein